MTDVTRKSARIDIASIRREQIVEAAVAIIAERGLQHLSLSEIESRIGMSRGQLTYYFKTKEDIFLAVFDRLVEMMHQQRGRENGGHEQPQCFGSWDEVVRFVLGAILEEPPRHPEFGPLQYTFLSQISHRRDFRERLARLYEDWRGQMAQLVADRLPSGPGNTGFAPRTFASLVQAIFHGVAMQIAADPNAFDREEIVKLCLDVLGTYLNSVVRRPRKSRIRTRNNRARGTNYKPVNGVSS
jgi:AcrR family transcriptional regulator